MGQIDSFKKVLGLDSPLEENPYKSILESAGAGPEEAEKGAEKEKKALKKRKEPAGPEPPSPRRTSISLSRRTYARLECYYFWLEHHGGKHYPSFGAFLEDLLDEALSGNSKAAAFVKEHDGVF